MTPQEFIAKWQDVTLSERSACQQHFLDLCEVLGQPKPAAADPTGAWYTFERGVEKADGGDGWADVWLRGHFGWEYKGKKKNLKAAYDQLLLYRESLENPPLLVVCDLDRFEVHTNFTNTAKRVYAFDLQGLADPSNLDVLRKLFIDPEALRPGQTSQAITEQAAELFGQLADGMRVRGIAAPDAAHFLMRLMFCMFAEDIELLPNKVFSRLLAGAKKDPARLSKLLGDLFDAMCHGGNFGADEILYFDGGLFADAQAIDLRPSEIETLSTVATFDWSVVEPSIFGTLFERTLDPAKRSQIGAHYTSRPDIETLLEPVMMAPLRREWEEVKRKCAELLPKFNRTTGTKSGRPGKESKARRDFDRLLLDFVERLAHVTVLDPACGSGNFLYVALHLLLNLEKEVITFAANHGVGLLPQVRPTQLHGIEINPYAQQLAQVVIWIGFLQWMRDNGFSPPRNPVLEPIESIECRDAILDLSDPENPREPEWPEAEVIVGNPPFLGNKQMRSELGADYVASLWRLYGDRLPGMSDLVCYWFEKSRQMIETGRTRRFGLLATTGIKQVGGRRVLERIRESARIFWAVPDRDWVLDGASVRICMVGVEPKTATMPAEPDGTLALEIHADLTSGCDLSAARALKANRGVCFMGTTKVGDFDIPEEMAKAMLRAASPNGLPTSDVLRPFRNGSDIVQKCSCRWIVDFGVALPLETASLYERPFEYLVQYVKPDRERNNDKWRQSHWWLLGRTLAEFRKVMVGVHRYIGTARVAKHRLFVWLDAVVLPDSKVIAIARDDDFTFGVLSSSIHTRWAAFSGGLHGGERPTYNPTLCFETFPFPEPNEDQRDAISEAAKELDRLRSTWLNPPEWTRTETLEFPGSVDGPWKRYIDAATVDERGIGAVRYPRLVPKDEECAKQLKKRTLTNLYNERPTWLDLAHRKLDEAVFAAYGWEPSMSDEDLLAALLALNLERSAQTV